MLFLFYDTQVFYMLNFSELTLSPLLCYPHKPFWRTILRFDQSWNLYQSDSLTIGDNRLCQQLGHINCFVVYRLKHFFWYQIKSKLMLSLHFFSNGNVLVKLSVCVSEVWQYKLIIFGGLWSAASLSHSQLHRSHNRGSVQTQNISG